MEDVTKKCSYCQSEISEKATICPNCRKKQKKPTNKKMLIFMLILIGILIIVSAMSNNTSNNIPITSWSCSGDMKKEVANEYNSPSTVNFVSCNWDKSKWIYWEVDSQNWFGALVRSSFLCNWDSCIITQK